MGRRAVGIPRGPFYWCTNTSGAEANFPSCFRIGSVDALCGRLRLGDTQPVVLNIQMLGLGRRYRQGAALVCHASPFIRLCLR